MCDNYTVDQGASYQYAYTSVARNSCVIYNYTFVSQYVHQQVLKYEMQSQNITDILQFLLLPRHSGHQKFIYSLLPRF